MMPLTGATEKWCFACDVPDPESGKPLPPTVKWRSCVLGPDGPANPTTRLVLLTLASHMDTEGVCFPSYELLSLESGLSKKCVTVHMNRAHAGCWFIRTEKMGFAKGWRRFEYQATVPILSHGGERRTPRQSWSDRRRRRIVVNVAPDGGERGSTSW